MTPTSPTWGDVEDFLKADRWTQLPARARGGRRQSHIFFEKALTDGRVLKTHISHDRSSTISAGRFGRVLRDQLEVSRSEFWEAIRSGDEVDRPVPTDDEETVEHPLYVVRVLSGDLRMSPTEIEALSAEEAERLVHEHWSKPS